MNEEPNPGSTYEPFIIDSEENADFVLGLFADVEAKRQRVKQNYAALIEKLDKEEEQLNGRFWADLQRWVTEAIEGKKTKTVNLLNGEISLRTVPAHVTITDKNSAREYARKVNSGLITIVTLEKFDTVGYVASAKLALNYSGKLLPGCELVPERGSLSMKFDYGSKSGWEDDE